MDINFDPNEITIGEIELLEEGSGLDFGTIEQQIRTGHLSVKAMLGVVYMVGRKDNPEYTIDDARKVKIGEVEFTADPTEAAGE